MENYANFNFNFELRRNIMERPTLHDKVSIKEVQNFIIDLDKYCSFLENEKARSNDTTFLYTLTKLAKDYGWRGNYNEVIDFVIWCHDKFSVINPELDSLLKEKKCS